MRIYPPDALKALEDGTALVTGAIKVAAGTGVRLWGGYGPVTIDGEDYVGAGNAATLLVSDGQIGAQEAGVEIILSGVDPEALKLIDFGPARDAPAVIYEMIFDGSGANLLAVNVERRGRIDQITRDDTPGGDAQLRIRIEGAVRGLRRHGGRRRADADQRLYLGTDGAFRKVAHAGQKQLFLGGQRPTSAGSGSGGGFGWFADDVVSDVVKRVT